VLTLISQAFIIVLLLSFSFGPAFFALVNTSIKHGYKTGALLATGVFLSDCILCFLIIVLVDLGATNLIHDEKNQRFMGILAGVVLIIFGALYFKKPVKSSDSTIEIAKPSPFFMIIKGFFLNSLNPAIWLLWLGNVTAVSKTLNYSMVNMILFFSSTLGIVLLIEFAKAYASHKVKKVLTENVMQIINNISGVLLVIFGLALIYNHYF
jgi:threonine/homoserine/homoserine lactone efflux protein